MLKLLHIAGLSALLIGLLAGCVAKWDEGDCKNTNWFALGQRQGAAAAPFDIDKVQNQCQKDYQVTINRVAYDRGYNDGLKNQFCTAERGLALGKSGYNYRGDCQRVSKDRVFRRAWKQGLKSWCKPSIVKSYAENGKDFPSWCQSAAGVNMANLQAAYDDGKNISLQRQEIKSQISRLDYQIDQLQSQIDDKKKGGKAYRDLQSQLYILENERSNLKIRLYDNPS
jgi:hypothetical protein